MSKIKISPLSIIWITFLLLSKTSFIFPLVCAIFLHELGHLLCACFLKIKIKCFELSILSARIKTYKELSYVDELIFALGGPLLGFLGFALTFKIALNYIALPFFQNFLFPFSILSLCLTIFNLIPIATLDGGRILKCILCIIFSLDMANKILHFTSFFTLLVLWMLSVYLMLRMSNGTPMFIFCLIFFSKCFIFDKKNRDFERF